MNMQCLQLGDDVRSVHDVKLGVYLYYIISMYGYIKIQGLFYSTL